MLVTLAWMLLGPGAPPVVPPAEPPRRVSVWIDRDDPYARGDRARVYLSTEEAAYVTVLRVDTDGRIRMLFPREPWSDTYVRGRRTFQIAGLGNDWSFRVDDDPGVGYVFAVASPRPFDYEDITRGDYWDYRLIADGRIQGDPYVALTDLAARITPGGDYDYDIVPYQVEGRYQYPRFVCYDCHAYTSFEEWDPYGSRCARFRMVIYDDAAYYPYRYNRGRNVVVQRPLRPGPRFVFRDARPGEAYLSRRSGRPEEYRRRTPELERAPRPERRRVEQKRRPPDEADRVPEGLKPADRDTRRTPRARDLHPPRRTGEPELRRRRP